VAALSVGVTTARNPECKRGVAANVAAVLARYDIGRVCVVDGDPHDRDVTARLAVGGARLEDFGRVPPPAIGNVARMPAPGVAVLGCGTAGIGRIRLGAERAFPLLLSTFDVVVTDLLGGPTGPGQIVGSRLDVLDWLLLAVTPEPGAVAASRHFLEHFETARSRGVVGPPLQLGVLCTGDESSTEMTRGEVQAELDAPVVGSITQFWGRTEPNPGFGPALPMPELDAAVLDLHAVLQTGTATHQLV
jgi:cellulose biosynthesis protein BcsQ